METQKICKDCKHYFIYLSDHACKRNISTKICLITGKEEIQNILKCEYERYNSVSSEDCCGIKAKHFKPKIPQTIQI